MNAFVVIQYDVEQLSHTILSRLKSESVVFTELYELGEAEIATLQRADTIYIVVSETSMCSTAYQMLLSMTFPLLKKENCRLLNLDDTRIPSGFPLLQTLPEGKPTEAP